MWTHPSSVDSHTKYVVIRSTHGQSSTNPRQLSGIISNSRDIFCLRHQNKSFTIALTLEILRRESTPTMHFLYSVHTLQKVSAGPYLGPVHTAQLQPCKPFHLSFNWASHLKIDCKPRDLMWEWPKLSLVMWSTFLWSSHCLSVSGLGKIYA